MFITDNLTFVIYGTWVRYKNHELKLAQKTELTGLAIAYGSNFK
jgi:hypothetical protein